MAWTKPDFLRPPALSRLAVAGFLGVLAALFTAVGMQVAGTGIEGDAATVFPIAFLASSGIWIYGAIMARCVLNSKDGQLVAYTPITRRLLLRRVFEGAGPMAFLPVATAFAPLVITGNEGWGSMDVVVRAHLGINLGLLFLASVLVPLWEGISGRWVMFPIFVPRIPVALSLRKVNGLLLWVLVFLFQRIDSLLGLHATEKLLALLADAARALDSWGVPGRVVLLLFAPFLAVLPTADMRQDWAARSFATLWLVVPTGYALWHFVHYMRSDGEWHDKAAYEVHLEYREEIEQVMEVQAEAVSHREATEAAYSWTMSKDLTPGSDTVPEGSYLENAPPERVVLEARRHPFDKHASGIAQRVAWYLADHGLLVIGLSGIVLWVTRPERGWLGCSAPTWVVLAVFVSAFRASENLREKTLAPIPVPLRWPALWREALRSYQRVFLPADATILLFAWVSSRSVLAPLLVAPAIAMARVGAAILQVPLGHGTAGRRTQTDLLKFVLVTWGMLSFGVLAALGFVAGMDGYNGRAIEWPWRTWAIMTGLPAVVLLLIALPAYAWCAWRRGTGVIRNQQETNGT